jgi:hypothetical protein
MRWMLMCLLSCLLAGCFSWTTHVPMSKPPSDVMVDCKTEHRVVFALVFVSSHWKGCDESAMERLGYRRVDGGLSSPPAAEP